MKTRLTALLTVAAAYQLPRRATLQKAAALAATAGVPPAFADSVPGELPQAVPGAGAIVRLSTPQINGKLSKIPVVALVNADDAPFLTGGNGKIGYFFLDPQEAFRELKLLQKSGSPDARLKVVTLPEVYFNLVRGDSRELGGELRLRPSRRQIVLANRALSTQPSKNSFLGILPTSLDEGKGQVPIFYSEKVAYESKDGSEQSFPFFLSKDDLDKAYDDLLKLTGEASPANAASTGRSDGESGGIPIGLVRVATLDGLVDQMLSGEVDLSKAVIVASRSSLVGVRSIVQDGI